VQLADVKSNKFISELIAFIGFLLIAVILGFTIGKGMLLTASIYIVLPFIIGYLYMVFNDPKIGLISVLHFSFLANGIGRYVPIDIPWGLIIDALLVLTVIATIFKNSKEDAKKINNPIFFIMLVWFIYTLVQLVNPEARSKEAWFFAVRGVSLYLIQIIPLILILMNKKEDMDQVIKIWFIWSLVSALYGFKMDILGVTGGERKWLDDGGKITHEIHGQIKNFFLLF
jgi:hypothetical protein